MVVRIERKTIKEKKRETENKTGKGNRVGLIFALRGQTGRRQAVT